jgi:hypothetical protein
MTPNAIFGVDDYQNLSLGVAPKINAGQQFTIQATLIMKARSDDSTL